MAINNSDRLFGIKEYFFINNAHFSLTNIVLKTQKDATYKDELYGRLLPAINRACNYYQRHYPFLDESETFFAVFNTTEHLLGSYQKSKGSFLSFWSSCVKSCLIRLVAKTWRNINDAREVTSAHATDCRTGEEAPECPIVPDLLLENIAENCHPDELSAYILYLAGYPAGQSAQMLGKRVVFVRSAIKKVNLSIDKRKVAYSPL